MGLSSVVRWCVRERRCRGASSILLAACAVGREAPSRPQAFTRSFAAFLDLSRALAATMVLLVHLRDPLFRGWSALDPSERNPLVRLWFFFGGMGFEAVVVFFVLSGFLVGGIGWGKVRSGSFCSSSASWRGSSARGRFCTACRRHLLKGSRSTLGPSLRSWRCHGDSPG